MLAWLVQFSAVERVICALNEVGSVTPGMEGIPDKFSEVVTRPSTTAPMLAPPCAWNFARSAADGPPGSEQVRDPFGATAIVVVLLTTLLILITSGTRH